MVLILMLMMLGARDSAYLTLIMQFDTEVASYAYLSIMTCASCASFILVG